MSTLLNDSTGTLKATYGYDAYGGKDDKLSANDDGARANDPLNPYRYSGRRFDTGSGTIDMGARRFGPDAQSFLQPDSYAGALANLGLSMDPLTGNRYGLAAGNPVTFVEVDGHRLRENGAGTGRFTPTTGNYSGVNKVIPGNPAYRGAYSGETLGDVAKSVALIPVGVVKGAGKAGWEVLQAGGQAAHAAGSCIGSPIECRDNVWAFGSAVADDPGGFVAGVAESVVGPTLKLLAEGKYSEAFGHLAASAAGGGLIKGVKGVAGARATAGASWLDDAAAPIGRRGNPIEIAPGTNPSAIIGGRQFTGHALDRMQGRGIMPSVVEDAIATSRGITGADGSIIHYSTSNNISVVLNADGSVRTVSYGVFKPR